MQAMQKKGGIQYDGVVDCFRKILKSEGVQGFYNNIQGSVFGVALANLVTFYCAGSAGIPKVSLLVRESPLLRISKNHLVLKNCILCDSSFSFVPRLT